MTLSDKKCKRCGGELENSKDGNFASCIYCGWKYTLHTPSACLADSGKLSAPDDSEKITEPSEGKITESSDCRLTESSSDKITE